jgi:type IV pilus assembly protein PilA
MSVPQRKGFTLLEILLVIAAIGILAAIVLVALNPNRQLAQARNAQRRSDVLAISNAIYQSIIDDASSGSTATIGLIPTTKTEILKQDATQLTLPAVNTNCVNSTTTQLPVNLNSLTTNGIYLQKIPQDRNEPTASICSGYAAQKDANNRITISSENAELSETISVTR